MLIDCPSCAQTYRVDRAAFQAHARAVVCAACDTRWIVEPDLPALVPDAPPANDDAPAPRRATLAQRRGPAAPPRRAPRALAPLAAAACLALAMGAIGARTAIVRAVPRLAGAYAALGLPVNVRGLQFGEVATARVGEGAGQVEVSGVIRNLAHVRTAVPRIAFDVRDAAGATVASWTAPAVKGALAPAETLRFAVPAPALPAGATDIVVRFASADDGLPPAKLVSRPKS